MKLRDQSGEVQLYLQRDDVAELDASARRAGNETAETSLDTGDFIEAKRSDDHNTNRRKIRWRTSELRLLTKSLRPMPEKLENKEERLRRRAMLI
ncbi:hypothetical protein [Candidatus Minimicrobia naudis]